ncbi:hypothetical protein A33I_04970 [Alkalihalophilus marmarensis DSM 21297]|jgi:hypothetical protein|uniref:Uncharacterized protein n=1 Tax=Alkalihalophilus marmarensis DSM 21297 TaxID=1188261 RepID=U6SVJ4_9BACI|nr:hypothetical protein A33I_04970 [Alkalihalophilus marmarensis DSM 21297]
MIGQKETVANNVAFFIKSLLKADDLISVGGETDD